MEDTEDHIETLETLQQTSPRSAQRLTCWDGVLGCNLLSAKKFHHDANSELSQQPELQPLVSPEITLNRNSVFRQTLSRVMSFVNRNNENRAFIKSCKNDNIKCCRPDLTNLTENQLKLLVQHYRDQVQKIDDKLKGLKPPQKLDIKTASEEVFSEDLVDKILKVVPFQGVTGIMNMDQDCYAIVVLQGLVFCPPFLDFVAKKTPETILDHAIRSFVAQYLTQFSFISCNLIANTVCPELGAEQEDAERFYEGLADNYFDDVLGKVTTYYKLVCCSCRRVTRNSGSDSHVMLEWPQEELYETVTVTEMIENTRVTKYLSDKKCDNCNSTGCNMITTYKFPNIFLVNLSPFYYTETNNPYRRGSLERVPRKSSVEFSRVQDFGPLSTDKQGCFYNLACIVYYTESSLNTGHYTARTFRDGLSYVTDDAYAGQESDGEIDRIRGHPYFAIYYKESLRCMSNVQEDLEVSIDTDNQKNGIGLN